MNILAPVNHMEAAVDLIDAGAAEIYLGADDELFSLETDLEGREALY